MTYKDFSIKLAQKAGKIISSDFSLQMKRDWKSDNTPVTETDKKINALVLKEVKKEFPQHDILSEEGSDMTQNSDFVWVCDPLDGTVPFSHGLATSVFSLALVKKGVSIAGVVYDPYLKRVFYAEKGHGALLNGKKITVSKADELKNSVVGLTIWKDMPYFDAAKMAGELNKAGVKTINTGSIIHMGTLVAAGEFIATIFPGQTAHDSAALKIIVEEAGGVVTDLYGNEQRYDKDVKGCVTSNGKTHERILNLIKEALK